MSRNCFSEINSTAALILGASIVFATILGAYLGYGIGRDIAIQQNQREAVLQHQQEAQQLQQERQENYPDERR